MEELPTEIISEICRYLDSESFINLCKTCRTFRELREDKYFRKITKLHDRYHLLFIKAEQEYCDEYGRPTYIRYDRYYYQCRAKSVKKAIYNFYKSIILHEIKLPIDVHYVEQREMYNLRDKLYSNMRIMRQRDLDNIIVLKGGKIKRINDFIDVSYNKDFLKEVRREIVDKWFNKNQKKYFRKMRKAIYKSLHSGQEQH